MTYRTVLLTYWYGRYETYQTYRTVLLRTGTFEGKTSENVPYRTPLL
jgi:hypothetical protein